MTRFLGNTLLPFFFVFLGSLIETEDREKGYPSYKIKELLRKLDDVFYTGSKGSCQGFRVLLGPLPFFR